MPDNEKKQKDEKAEKKDKTFSGKLCKTGSKDMKGKKLKAIKRTVSDPEWVCLKCARASSKKSNLCDPDKIDS